MKGERPKARPKSLLHKRAPLGCPDATETEIIGALWVLAEQAGAIILINLVLRLVTKSGLGA
mgnify:CR=1 FL=1